MACDGIQPRTLTGNRSDSELPNTDLEYLEEIKNEVDYNWGWYLKK